MLLQMSPCITIRRRRKMWLSKYGLLCALLNSPFRTLQKPIAIRFFTKTIVSTLSKSLNSIFYTYFSLHSTVKNYGYYFSQGSINIVLEYMNESSLNKVICFSSLLTYSITAEKIRFLVVFCDVLHGN